MMTAQGGVGQHRHQGHPNGSVARLAFIILCAALFIWGIGLLGADVGSWVVLIVCSGLATAICMA